MEQVVLIIHLLLAIGLVVAVLLQKSEGGGLGMGSGGSGGGMSGLMSGRAAADLLTRTTALFAVGFMITSLILAILAGSGEKSKSILDQTQPVKVPTEETSGPAVPLAK